MVALDVASVETSTFQSCCHIFKATVGAGIFLLPTFFSNVGILPGIVAIAIAGLITADCILLLVHTKGVVAPFRPTLQHYEEVSALLTSSAVRTWVKLSLLFSQFGFCIMYLQYSGGLFSDAISEISYNWWVIAGVIVVTPLTFLSNRLHIMAWSSLLATSYVFLTLLLTIGFLFQRTTPSDAEMSRPLGSNIFVFFAGAMTSFQCIGVILPIENTLVDKKPFPQSIAMTVLVITVLYGFFGSAGYWSFGSRLHRSVVNTLPWTFLGLIARCSLGLALWLTFPVQFFPAIQVLERFVPTVGENNTAVERNARQYIFIAMRVVMTTVLGAISALCGAETIALLQSLIGAVASTMLAVGIPALLFLRLPPPEELEQVELKSISDMEALFVPYTHLWRPRSSDRFRRLRATVYFLLAVTISIYSTVTVIQEWWQRGHEQGPAGGGGSVITTPNPT